MHWKTLIITSLILLLLIAPAESWWRRRRRRRRSPPPPDTTPPSFGSTCPGPDTYTTSEADGRRVVTYSTPRATDDRGTPTLSRTAGPASGSRFNEGQTTVTYRATDGAGNIAYCHIRITVNVLRCPSVGSSSHRSHTCTKTNIAGSVCTFHCQTGYYLSGSSGVTCQSNRVWNGGFPTCQVRTCSPSLTSLSNGQISCTNSNRWNSVCTFRCNTGYGLSSGGSSYARTCGNGWSGTSPSCTDNEPPSLTCPGPISVEAEDRLTSAVVTWVVPVPTDNVPVGLTISRTQGSAPGSRFNQGSHAIRYRAEDAAGNTQDCTISIIIRVITCTPAPQSGNHLQVSCPHGHVKGASCTFSCDPGYQLIGSGSSTCQSSGSWSASQPSCRILRCTNLSVPAHGSYRYEGSCGNTYGTWCHFECDTGYSITGSPSRRCVVAEGQTTVSWSGSTTACQINTCQTPTPGEGLAATDANACSAGNSVAYGTTCSYECSEGFWLVGTPSITCGPDSQWLQTLPLCQEITCASSDLPAPANGIKSGCYGDYVPYGTTCSLSCDWGYRPTTTTQRTCQSDNSDSGVWSGGTITCNIVTCSPLSVPAFGSAVTCLCNGQSRSSSARQAFDSVCQLACNTGYTLSGSASRTCLVSGSWDGTTTVCTDITEPVLQCPANQRIFAREGHRLVSVSWNWEPFTGTDAGQEITAVLLSINSQPVSGSKPTTLEEGTYSLVYKATDTAGNVGSCSMQIEAKVTQCLGLQTPTHGILRLATGHGSCSEGVVYGSQCDISCQTGYSLSSGGSSLRRKCLRQTAGSTQGYWNSSQPTCQANTCPYPAIVNGYISGCAGDTATYGDSCQFHCDLGHRSTNGQSHRVRQCQADSSWSGPDFQCTVLVTCPGAFSIPHGMVEPTLCGQSQALPYNTVCHFTCSDGFRQEGPNTKTCTDHGSWDSSQNVACIDEQRPRFSVDCPQHVTVNSEFGTTSGTVTFDPPTATDNSGFVTVTRQAGHLAPGSSFPEGRTTVSYIAVDPVALSEQCDVIVTVVVYRCERLQAPTSGSIHCDHASAIAGTQCSLQCNTGYILSGSHHRVCQLTSINTAYWDGEPTGCTIVRCPSQPSPPNSVKSGCSLPSEPYGTECSFYCVTGYEAETSDGGRSRCLADGSWSGTDLVCQEIECPVLTPSTGINVSPSSCSNRPVFGNSCMFSCSQQGFRIEPIESAYIHCVGTGIWSGDISQIICVDMDNPELNCPSAMTEYAERGSTVAQVNFQVTASDNSGQQPTVTCDPQPGQFDLGQYLVFCIARDPAGNSATCSFQVEIVERTCTALPIPAYGEYIGDCCQVYGCMCYLKCIDGYQLIGSSQASCEFNGTSTYWQQDITPHCQLITCEPLSLPDAVQVTPSMCTTGRPLAGTHCFFFCPHGLSLIGNISQVSCGWRGLWDTETGNLPTDCKDRIPPVLTFCPGPIYATRGGGEVGVSVTFDIPTARDNDPSGSLSLETSPSSITSPHSFNESTQVSYTFTDEGGNSVTCTFRIYVFDDLEPEVVYCPDDYDITVSDTLTEVTWEEPVFRDPLGHDLVISNNVAEGNKAILPWGRHTVVYTAINPDNGQKAVCQFAIDIKPNSCPALPRPQNGAVSCVPSGLICTAFCNENYEFSRLRGRGVLGTVPDQYVCGIMSGRWTPHDRVPDCSRRRGDASLPMSLLYFSGDCSDQSTRDNIALAFIALVQTSPFMDACTLTDKCNIENVLVYCGSGGQRLGRGPGLHRRRRGTDTDDQGMSDDALWHKLFARLEATHAQRQKRDTDINFGVLISFDLSYEIDYETGMDTEDAVSTAEAQLKDRADHLMTAIGNGSMPALNMSGMTLEADTDMMSYGNTVVTCKPGYVISNDSLYCTACSSGSWYNKLTEECDNCPRGSYQNQQAAMSCIECPPGTTTATEGAKNSSSCVDECPVGTYSTSGVVPCFKCLIGYFQSLPGQSSCQPCPAGTTTLDYGTQTADQCLEICPAGSYSSTGLAPCHPCEQRYYQPNSQKRHCVLCPGRTTTSGSGSTSLHQCIDVDDCASSPCDHQATCVDLIDGYRCDCPPGYEGPRCTDDIDDCIDHRCVNEATCVDRLMAYTCQCSPGFTGEFCEMNLDECASTPCANDGVCLDEVNCYHCQCMPNYHGLHCELEMNSCSPSPCQHGVCQLRDGGYQCQCAAGYRGTNCTLDINECSSNPCHNGAMCQDMANGYHCVCTAGYEGTHCENNVNWCAESPCHSGSSCVHLGSTFSCSCPAHRSGELCDQTPCQNDGTFQVNPDGTYLCYCLPGFGGNNCEIEIDECASEPCSNGATCVDGLNAVQCDCPPGFEGETCTVDVDECLSNPCGAANTCEDNVNGYICLCAPGLTGTHCDDHIDYCDPSACQHGSTCSNTGTGYQCTCAAGFTGPDCETNINDCASRPCQHDGFCADLDNSFVCFCLAGFLGPLCENNIDDCSPSACHNDGSCIDGINDFTCVCPNGFTGAQCEEQVNYCQSSPCQHQGICKNDPPAGYRCICSAGYAGQNCEEDVDECASYPCMNALSCADGINSYTCVCMEGYVGTNCEEEIDECVSEPCSNHGTCLDLVAGYRCMCAPGYTGVTCQLDIDECAAVSCHNGACLDKVNGFQCLCLPGWTGILCDEDIDECESAPCLHNSECQDQLNAYVCHCSPGYNGTNCQEDINECLTEQCQHGATCIDKVADFDCNCLYGYRGRYCEEEIDECLSNPCHNGASCLDEVGAFSCDCLTGFTGALCDVEVRSDPCTSAPCSNGASCINEGNSFFCSCVDGYSGELCDVNVNECMSQPCEHNALCIDDIDAYQCACLPGYSGIHCERELPTDFDLAFTNPTASDVIAVNNVTSGDLSALSLTLWFRSPACTDDIIMVKLSSAETSILEIRNPCNLLLSILGHYVGVGSRTDYCEERWHNVMLVLKYQTDLEWKLYIDQSLAAGGAVSTLTGKFPSGLSLSIGPTGSETGAGGCQLELSGLNIWREAMNEVEVLDIATYCQPLQPGNMFAWGQMMTLPGSVITQTLRAPSVCDDYDECSSTPCEYGGTCEDQLGTFLCHCTEGRLGNRCQTVLDLCLLNPCQNDGICQSDLFGFSCQCLVGYIGRVCENQMVDGQWSTWMAWSPCSKTCGSGSKLRFRSCDNPVPHNGGAQCPGTFYQSGTCNTDPCPTCPVLRSPLRGFIDCNETEVGEISCRIWCRDNYVFSSPPQPEYQCGPSTDYVWSHNPENSRSVRLPSCNLMVPRVAMSANISVTYPELHCDSLSDQRDIYASAAATLHNTTQGATGCLAENTCVANITVSNCEAHAHRSTRAAVRRRRSPSPVRLTIVFTIADHASLGRSNVPDNGSVLTEMEFSSTLEEVTELMQQGQFGIMYHGELAQPDIETVVEDCWDVCPEGTVESEQEGLCVQCGEGLIWEWDAVTLDYVCTPCPVNTYKEEQKNICTDCPHGRVTSGPGATNISQCSAVGKDSPAETVNVQVIVISVACVGIILIIAIVGLAFYKLKKQKVPQKLSVVDKSSAVHVIPDIFQASSASRVIKQAKPAGSPIGESLAGDTVSEEQSLSGILQLTKTKL